MTTKRELRIILANNISYQTIGLWGIKNKNKNPKLKNQGNKVKWQHCATVGTVGVHCAVCTSYVANTYSVLHSGSLQRKMRGFLTIP